MLERLDRWCDAHARLALAAIVLVAAGIRVAALWSFSHSIYGDQLAPDEQIFDLYARAVLKGEALPTIVGFNAHVPAYLFALAYSVLGVDPDSVRIVNVVLGSATCICLYFAGEALHGRSTGLIAALLGAVYGPFILASITAHKTALEVLLVALALAIGVRVVGRPRVVRFAWLGALLALATHVRGNVLVLIPLAPLGFAWVWRKRFSDTAPLGPKLAAYGVGLALVLVPLSSGGVLGATEHGFNLYLANSLDNPTPYYRSARFAPAQPSLQGGGFVLKASLEAGRTLSVAEARDHYTDVLRAEWAANPAAAMNKALAKLAGSLNSYEHAHNLNLAFVSRFVPPLALPWLGFGWLLACAALGLRGAGHAAARAWLVMMAVAYWLTLVIFFSEIRIRAPLGVLLMPLAALGLHNLAGRRGRALAIDAVLVAACLVATRLPVPGAGDMTSAYNFHGLLLFDRGDYEGAERFYRASHEQAGIDSQAALIGLAAIALKREDLDAAESLLAELDDDDYKASEKHAQLGAIAVRRHRLEDAARSFETALEINPGMLQLYPLLEVVYARLARPDQVTDIRRRHQYAKSFFESD